MNPFNVNIDLTSCLENETGELHALQYAAQGSTEQRVCHLQTRAPRSDTETQAVRWAVGTTLTLLVQHVLYA